MQIKIILITFLLSLNCYIDAQENCINADFENGNLNGWVTTGIAELVTGATDYYGGFPVSAPGGNYSLRLGNSVTYPQPISTATKTFIVSEDHPYILYQFALVNLGYPHETIEAARSSFRILDSVNNEIECTFYEVFAANGGPPGFEFSTRPAESNLSAECCYQISYLKWNSVLVDLRAHIDKQVKIELTNTWCIYGPDWGYSYFDAQCTNLEIAQNCNLSDTIKLSAPNAATSYLWSNGDTTQTINITDLTIGSSYSCTFTYDGINETCEDITIFSEKKIIPTYISSKFTLEDKFHCSGQEIEITNQSTVQTYHTNDSINYILIDTIPQVNYWIYGNSQTFYEQNPTIVFNESGNQQIELITYYGECSDTSFLTVPIYSGINPPILYATNPFCAGDEAELGAEEADPYEIVWTGPNEFSSNNFQNVFNLNLENIGNYSAYFYNDTCPSSIVSIHLAPENPYTFENINIPNIITTNKDMVNEEFSLPDAIYNCLTFEINFYNRWGTKVYTQTNTSPTFKGVDFNGKQLDAGVYFYTIDHQTGNISGFLHIEY